MRDDLLAIIRRASMMGAAEAMAAMDPKGDRLSQREAVRLYGRGFIARNAGRLHVTANGNRREYSRAELEALRQADGIAAIMVRIENQLF